MRKRHFIDKLIDKTSKTTKNANCDVKVGAKVEMPNFFACVLRDVDMIVCNNSNITNFQHSDWLF